MSGAACKQAMCAGWPMPRKEPIPVVQGHRAREDEAEGRRVLISTAFTDGADAHKKSDSWKAMIDAIGETPMTDDQIKTAQAYIHELGDG